MNYQMRVFAAMTFMALVPTLLLAQKPPAPPPKPAPSPQPSDPTINPSSPPFLNADPMQRSGDRVLFIRGRITTSDGTPVPHDVVVERVCNSRVRQQVHVSPGGDFSMDLGSKTDSFIDASGDAASRSVRTGNNSVLGIPRQELMSCEIRASVSGFRSSSIDLVSLTPTASALDVGQIVLNRTEKVKGLTLSATIFKAPPTARKAFEKGLEAERKEKLVEANKYFEQAVEIYPKFTNAWFELGVVLQQQGKDDAAGNAYNQATSIDSKFLPPYLSLAALAYKEHKWSEVLLLTGHIVDLDPMSHVNGYILDLDSMDYAEAYFYDAAANFNLNRLEGAKKSALKAERLDLRSRFPQLHLLLAKIYSRENKYDAAISHIQTYLDLAPNAKDADLVREWQTELKKRDASEVAREKSDQK